MEGPQRRHDPHPGRGRSQAERVGYRAAQQQYPGDDARISMQPTMPTPPSVAAPPPRADHVERPHVFWWSSILFGMSLLALLALSDGAYALWESRVTTWLPQSLLRVVLCAAVAAHIGEGLYAYRLAGRLGLQRSQLGWGMQTLVLGFPSLRLLLRRAT